MPPPKLGELPLIVLLVTLMVPVSLKMPPPTPKPALELPLIVLLLMLTVAVLLLRIPPPEEPLGTCPFEIVNPENVTTPGPAAVTLKTRLLLLPLIVNRFAPGP